MKSALFAAGCALILATTRAGAQALAPDPTIAQLRDSIRLLLEERNTFQKELANAGLTNPTSVTYTQVRPFDDRVFVKFGLNKPARARVIVESDDRTIRQVALADDYKDSHTIRIDQLVPRKAYFITVEALKNTSPGDVAVSRQGRDQALATYDQQLRFSTTPQVNPPQLQVETVTPSPTGLAISVRADQPTLFRLYVAPEIGGQPGEPVASGADLTRDEFDAPRNAPISNSATLAISGLEPEKPYYYRVVAVNKEGKTDEEGYRRIETAKAPSPFEFDGPLDIRFDVVRGLVVKWKSSAPATRGDLIADYKTPGVDNRMQVAQLADDGRSLEATLSTVDLLKAPPGSAIPVLRVQMSNGSVTRVMQVTLGVAMPASKEKIEQLPGVSKEDKESLKRAWDAIRDPNDDKKLRWADVAATVMKFLPVLF